MDENINCEKPIYINIHSNHWKYWKMILRFLHIFINLEKMKDK